MSTCQHCTRTTDLHLCTPCATNLADLLAELPWLLHQLDITLCRRDHLNSGGPGHTHVDANPINVGAMELMRQASATLHAIALDVSEIHASEQIPALVNASPPLIAAWLRGNVGAIANHPKAGEHYKAIEKLVGDPNPGPLHAAINRPATRFAGPCPTIRAHDRDGAPVRCGTTLWAHDDDVHTTCTRCGTPIHVEENIRRAAMLRDLLPAEVILDVLENLGEPVRPETLYGWITSGRLRSNLFLTARGITKRRLRPSDPRVYSVTRARQLRRRPPRNVPSPNGDSTANSNPAAAPQPEENPSCPTH